MTPTQKKQLKIVMGVTGTYYVLYKTAAGTRLRTRIESVLSSVKSSFTG